ncbi:MAG: hypothetical protein MJE68_11695 [Proteobacteria bacterium]|nr:hypothetical protein [Pseudomonadota bacterium]
MAGNTVHAKIGSKCQEGTKMIASGRPKSKAVEHSQKGKSERSVKVVKASKVDGGKKKTTKKATGQPSALEAPVAGNGGGGTRGQSQSCHQCRQSIHSSKGVSEVKSGRERLKCSQCTRYW